MVSFESSKNDEEPSAWKAITKKKRESLESLTRSSIEIAKETVLETMYALLFRIEAERQEQRLAHLYYFRWHFWMLFIPAALLTLVSGILAFLGETNRYQCTALGDTMGIVVGCFAVFATFLQALSNHLGYGTSADMHKAAAIDLQEISDGLKFDIMQTSLVDDSNKQAGLVQNYRGLYEQVMKGTKSTVPLKISQAFDMIDARLDSIVEQVEKHDINPQSTQVNDFMIDCVTMLYCEVASYTRYKYDEQKWWKFWQYVVFPWNVFPWITPDPSTAVDKTLEAIGRKHESIDKDVTNYLKLIMSDDVGLKVTGDDGVDLVVTPTDTDE